MYDYLQTLPMEIHTIWMKKFTGVSLIFLVNRYLLLASIIAELYANAPGYASSTRSRRFLSTIHDLIVVLITSRL